MLVGGCILFTFAGLLCVYTVLLLGFVDFVWGFVIAYYCGGCCLRCLFRFWVGWSGFALGGWVLWQVVSSLPEFALDLVLGLDTL